MINQNIANLKIQVLLKRKSIVWNVSLLISIECILCFWVTHLQRYIPLQYILAKNINLCFYKMHISTIPSVLKQVPYLHWKIIIFNGRNGNRRRIFRLKKRWYLCFSLYSLFGFLLWIHDTMQTQLICPCGQLLQAKKRKEKLTVKEIR